MKKLMIVLSLLFPFSANAENHYKLKYKDDGEGGKWSYFYKNGKLEYTQHLDATVWAILQDHWKTGKPLPYDAADVAKLVAQGQETAKPMKLEEMPGAAYTQWAPQQQVAIQPQKTQEQYQQEREQTFLSDAMYTDLWNELYQYEAKEYYRYGSRGEKRKWRDNYGDHWGNLSRSSRSDWYNYLFPKIDFSEIDQWSQRAHVEAENERQRYMQEMEAAGRN